MAHLVQVGSHWDLRRASPEIPAAREDLRCHHGHHTGASLEPTVEIVLHWRGAIHELSVSAKYHAQSVVSS
jgi:hypothetical protein